MRGKGRTTRPAPARARITPACAGKRKSCAAQKTSAWDHPRMCGEKLGVALLALAFKGSPPHVRGKGASKECGADRTQDHPRMCGEKGSRSVGFQPYKRITPACAGKRLKRSRSTVPPVAIVPLFPSVCNKPVASDGSPAGRDAPLFLPAENAVPASPAYNLRSL